MSESCMIVAEIGQTHEGSLGNALAFIDAVARTQAGGVKFQCHDGDLNTTWRPGVEHPQDRTRQDYWKRTGFTADQWWQLRWRARKRGLQFGMSAFSDEAYDLCYKLDLDFLKIPLGKSVAVLPRFLCDIYASWNFEDSPPEEIEDISWIQCVPLYPTPPSRLGVNRVGTDICVGLSSHCPEIGPSIEAIKTGKCKYLEHHVMWTRDQFGPDVKSSITIDELAELVKAVRAI